MTIPALMDRAYQYVLLMRLDKPVGSLLLLWPTLWALWLAGRGQPDQGTVVIFLLGVMVMRSAGCVINDIADRRIDPFVARTRERPLASGQATVTEALVLFLGLALVAFALVLSLNSLTISLSAVGILLAASYPFMKRYHHFPQIHLGMAFGWSIPMAYAALLEQLPWEAWLLWVANIVWSVIYDTEYAMVDREDDLKVGVKSTAIRFGDQDRRVIAWLQGGFLLLLILVGIVTDRGDIYYLGLFLAVWLLLYQQYLIRNREPAGCFQAFRHNNWLGFTVFCALVVDLLPD